MVNPWIEHVKAYAKEHDISYGCAITEAKASYTKKEKGGKSLNQEKIILLGYRDQIKALMRKREVPQLRLDDDRYNENEKKKAAIAIKAINKKISKLQEKGRAQRIKVQSMEGK